MVTLKKIAYMCVVFILGVLLLTGCGPTEEAAKPQKEIKNPKKLNDLAYDVNEKSGYTIYIEEKTGYHPYLVLTNDYNGDGNVLLLRKYVLDDLKPFNDEEGAEIKGGYYKNSFIDWYLNNDYLINLPKNLQNQVLESEIIITARTAWGRNGRDVPETETMPTKVFLLSYVELRPGPLDSLPLDGEPLKYYTDDINRILAKDSSGEPTTWITRSPYFGLPDMCKVITFDTRASASSVFSPLGARPAFCLDRELVIEKREDIKKGKSVYALKEVKE